MQRRILFLLPALFLFAAASARAQQQSSGLCHHGPIKDPAYYADLKELPGGKWTLSYIMDRAQAADASTPVVLVGLHGVSSPKPRAAKIDCAELRNVSGRTVKAVRLRWAVTERGADGAIVENGPVLAKGTLPVIEVEIPAGVAVKAGVRGADFHNFVQPLAVAGEVNGQYNVTISVARVEYADGTAEDLP